LRERTLALREPRVMGIVNVTPDSFYDRAGGADEALAQARAMVRAGAAVIDVGGRSYAAGNGDVPEDEERARVVPAVRAIAQAGLDVAISVDTVRASVADAALRAGAHLVNDCSGLADARLVAVVAEHGAALVVMHLRGRLAVREPEPFHYDDVVAEVGAYLAERAARALAGGVARDAVVLDPGLEFGKEPDADLEILARFGELRALGFPLLLAASRKRFLGRIVGKPAAELLPASLAAVAAGVAGGARLIRTHDVAATVDAVRVLWAIASATRVPLGRF